MEVDELQLDEDESVCEEIEVPNDNSEETTSAAEKEDDEVQQATGKSRSNSRCSQPEAKKRKQDVTQGQQHKSADFYATNLHVLISNLYLNTANRLPKAVPHPCLADPSRCMAKHRHALQPDAPSFRASTEMRQAYQENFYRYINMVEGMLSKKVFPCDEEDNVLDKCIFMLMRLTAKDMELEELKILYNRVRDVFFTMLLTFPPCLKPLRPYYRDTLGLKMKLNKHMQQKVHLYFDMLNEVMSSCTKEELSSETLYYETNETDDDDIVEVLEAYAEDLYMTNVLNKNINDTPIVTEGRPLKYEVKGNLICTKNFKSFRPGVKLARLFHVLEFFCMILEKDFLSWLDEHKMNKSGFDIFQEDSQPFVVQVFEITPNLEISKFGQQLFDTFGKAVASSLYKPRLQIIERYIAMLMEVSNTAELACDEKGWTFPNLGNKTQSLIGNFFKTFKRNNLSKVSTYVKVVPLFSQLYMRFTFVDLFLQIFDYPQNTAFSLQKVCKEFSDRVYLKYKRRAELVEDDDNELCREDYVKLLLYAFQAYCEWLKVTELWVSIATKEPLQPLHTITESPLATPVGVVNGDVGKIFRLDEMEKEAYTWHERINSETLIGRPPVKIQFIKVNMSNMKPRYTDMILTLRRLHTVLHSLVDDSQPNDLNLCEWLDYLNEWVFTQYKVVMPDDDDDDSELTTEPNTTV